MPDVIHPLKSIIKYQKEGIARGICSVCSSNPYVIEAAMEKALKDNAYVLIESTANQVNQFGGYTGMKPHDFRDFVSNIAKKVGLCYSKIILGGDHLGPLVWKSEPCEVAMHKAKELVRQYVLAGFTKIHLDTSMRLGGDSKWGAFETSVIAERGAALCAVAEKAYKELKRTHFEAIAPVYVIGSEVPIPGGSQKEEILKVTEVKDLEITIKEFKKAFLRCGLSYAWKNVIAVVVQPGVEFGDETIHEYDRIKAKKLSDYIRKVPGLVFEGHSTDYQTSNCLKQMVEDGIAILKVGPALTFAVREALFCLQNIHKELTAYSNTINPSKFDKVLDEAMLRNPVYWKNYYHGDENKVRLSRKYSLSDRCRYYLTEPDVRKSIDHLIGTLKNNRVSIALISQFLPIQYYKIRNGILKNDPEEIIKDKIINVLDEYSYATGI
jgi:D-tagatose-1,6-bisphosphate aldolase subunit GatZ/KbaZ